MENAFTQAIKELRQRQTKPERLLWSRLRNKHVMGVKFRRQEPIRSYVVDFVSFENKLIIELDGNFHNKEENKFNDTQRTMWLESQGYQVLRFWNDEVLNHFEKVISKTREALDVCPHPNPLP